MTQVPHPGALIWYSVCIWRHDVAWPLEGDNAAEPLVALTREGWGQRKDGTNLRFTHGGKNGLFANAPAWVARCLRAVRWRDAPGKDGREEVGSNKSTLVRRKGGAAPFNFR